MTPPRSSTTSSPSREPGATARRSLARSGTAPASCSVEAAAFGYGTKMLHRILRMHHALALIRQGARPAEGAARAGYADQPHLSREIRDMAGVPLSELMM
jgi:AraC-like DNA-binding protein